MALVASFYALNKGYPDKVQKIIDKKLKKDWLKNGALGHSLQNCLSSTYPINVCTSIVKPAIDLCFDL